MAGNQIVTFANPMTYKVGQGPIQVAINDLNGDGRLDLAVANSESTGVDDVSVLLGGVDDAGKPTFQRATTYDVKNPGTSVIIADLNGDGAADIVAGSSSIASASPNILSVLFGAVDNNGRPTGSFPTVKAFAAGIFPRSVTVADVNGDGVQDIVAANFGSEKVSVLLGARSTDGEFTFLARQDYYAGLSPKNVIVADVNGDGKPDILVSNTSEDSISILLGDDINGQRTFQARQIFDLGGGTIYALAVADVNGDGKLDLVATSSGPSGSSTLSVLLGSGVDPSGKPIYQPVATYDVGSLAYSIAIADINGDGRLDIVTANSGENTISILLGGDVSNGEPAFQAQTKIATRATPSSIAIADINGDGKQDIVVTNQGDDSVSVLLNTTLFPRAIIGTHAGQTTTGEARIHPFTGVRVRDDAAGGQVTLTIKISNGAGGVDGYLTVDGALTSSAAIFEDLGKGQYSITGSASDVTTKLQSLLFTTFPRQPNTSRTNTFTLSEVSGSETPIIDNTTTVITSYPAVGPRITSGDAVLLLGQISTSVPVYVATAKALNANPDLQFSLTGEDAKFFNIDASGKVYFKDAADFTKPEPSDRVYHITLQASDRGQVSTKDVDIRVNKISFAKTDYDLGKPAESITIADINGDGRQDIVATHNGDATASVLLGGVDGDGKQTFLYRTDYKGPIPDGPAPSLDLDGDGKPDLVRLVSGIVGNAYTDVVSIQFGDGVDAEGKPTYRPAMTYYAGYIPQSLAIADFNGDGRLDIATIPYSDNVSILFGAVDAEGKPTFLPQVKYPNSVGYDIVAADINGDGKPDIVLNNFDDNSVSVLLNTTLFPRAIKGTLGGQKTTSEAPVHPFSGVILMDDTSGAIQTLTIALSDGAGGFGGTLSVESGAPITAAFTALGDGKYQLTGSAAEVTKALHALTFTPTPGAPGTQTTTTFSLKDQSSADATAILIDSKTTVINFDPFTGKIAGVAFLDRNANKTQDANDRGLAGLEVKLFDQNGAILKASTTTDANGQYSFGALADGTYKLSFQVPDGYKADQGALDRNGNLVVEAIVANGATSLLNEAFEPRLTSDFNGDHHSDILLQNASGALYVWQMGDGADGLTIKTGAFIGGYDGPGAKWQMKATGDFDGDGKSDLLLQYKDTGAVFVWQMNGDGKTIKAGGFVGGFDGPGAKWQVKATGDFDGDGKSDILLQYADTGAVYIWRMDGTNIIKGSFVGGFDGPGAKWQVKGTGDFNGDGKSDILMQYADTGACYVWEMGDGADGLTIKAGGFVGGYGGPGADWHATA